MQGLTCASCAKAVAGKERAEPEAELCDKPTSAARRVVPASSAAHVTAQAHSSASALPQPVSNQDGINEDDSAGGHGSQQPLLNGGPGTSVSRRGNQPSQSSPVQQQPVQPNEQPGPCSSSSGPSSEAASLATGSATQLQYTWSDPNVSSFVQGFQSGGGHVEMNFQGCRMKNCKLQGVEPLFDK